MKLSKAIEILNHHQIFLKDETDYDFFSAVKLGIEALKRIQATRLVRKEGVIVLLPGETEED